MIFRIALVLIFSCFSFTTKASDSQQFQLFTEISPNICKSIGIDIDPLLSISKNTRGDLRKVFVGKSRLKYNRDDYYLQVEAFDIDGDKILDLLATDWRGSGGKKFYLGYYIFKGKGDLLKNKKILKKFLLNSKLQERHGNGKPPVFGRDILIGEDSSTAKLESFIGYHKVDPFEYKGNMYIHAEKEEKSRRLIFDIKNNTYCAL